MVIPNENADIYYDLKDKFNDLEAEELIAAICVELQNQNLAAFSSFGAYSSLLLSMISEVNKNIPILFIDTEKHFKETLKFVKNVEAEYGLNNIIRLKPDSKIINNIDSKGNLWQLNPNRCCWARKVEPLDRYLRENSFRLIFTGRRYYQTPERSNLEKIEMDEKGIIKVNPLAFWSKNKVIREFNNRKLIQHPLVKEGYQSIGCSTCTVIASPGENYRSGRWAHTATDDHKQKTECGIYLNNAEKSI